MEPLGPLSRIIATVKRAPIYCSDRASLRRRWLSQWLLVLFIAAVHGVPGLHLVWHKNNHVHDLGGIRWLAAAREAHPHVHTTPHHVEHAAETTASTVALTASTRVPRAEFVAGLASVEGPPHLALGPAHGQQSLFEMRGFGRLAEPLLRLSSSRLCQSTPPPPSFLTKPRARAPPAAV